MVEINEAALQKAANDLAKHVETELNRILAQTQDEMAGEPAEQIRPVLEQRIAQEVPQYHPNAEALDKWSQQISDAGA